MSEKNDDTLNILSDLVALARRRGADVADALMARHLSISHTSRMGNVEHHEHAEDRGVGLRVILDGREASISSDDIDPQNFPALVDQAIAMAKVVPSDPYIGLCPPEQLFAGPYKDLDLVDHNAPEIKTLMEWAVRAEAAGRAVAGVVNSDGASAQWSESRSWICGSNGLAQSFANTAAGISCTMVAGDENGMEIDYDYSHCVHAQDLRSPEDIGESAGKRATAALGSRKIKTGAFPVIFDARVSASLLGHLAGAINGRAIARKSSFLLESLGKQVFAKDISIVDDPHRRRGLASRAVDGEGLANGALSVIEDGVLQCWILDLATARQLGASSNARAARSGAGRPSPSVTNFTLQAGAQSRAELIGSLSSGLLVTSIMGQGVNLVTGDYSRGASGFWIENGEIAYPVSELTIASSLQDMFARMTAADDLEFRQTINAPSLLIEQMTIAGN